MSLEVKKHFVMWAKSSCGYCDKAKTLLSTGDHSHTIFTMDDSPELLDKVQEKFGYYTVPVIIVRHSDGEARFVGGFTDLQELLEKT